MSLSSSLTRALLVSLLAASLLSSSLGETSLSRGLFIASLFLIAFTAVSDVLFESPSRPSSPSPPPFSSGLFWSLVKLYGLLGLALLSWLLFQEKDVGRSFFNSFDPAAGRPRPHKNYASDCRIFTPENPESSWANVKDIVFDRFFASHFLGHFLRVFMFRDPLLIAVYTIFFEYIEIAFAPMLANFNECWWDRWIIDVACNLTGCFLGYLVFKTYNLEFYDLMYSFKEKRFVFLDSRTSFLIFLGYNFYQSMIDLNAFFLNYVLQWPATSVLCIIRMAFGLAGIVAANTEFHEYLQTGKVRLMMLLLALTPISEVFIIIRYGIGEFPFLDSYPAWILASFAFIIIGILFVFLYYPFPYEKLSRPRSNSTKSKKVR